MNLQKLCTNTLSKRMPEVSYGHKKGKAYYIAPRQPDTLASVRTWGILGEHAV